MQDENLGAVILYVDSGGGAASAAEAMRRILVETARRKRRVRHGGRVKRVPLEHLTLADNDVFAGIRLALNDTQDTAVLAGVGYDVKTSETYLNIEADRRLGENYVAELRARFFTNAEPGDTSYAIEKDDYLQLQLSRYF